MNTKEYILNQFKLYPQLELQDLMKFLYQSSFGCEHLVSDFSTVKSSIEQELQNHQDSSNSIEELDGDYIRLHLNYGLNVNTLSTLFIRSCQQEKNGIKQLEDKIQTLLDLIFDNTLPFSFEKSKDLLLKWKKEGYPAIHHSDTFNQLYHPAYRLIHKKYIPFLELFKYIDNNHPSMFQLMVVVLLVRLHLQTYLNKYMTVTYLKWMISFYNLFKGQKKGLKVLEKMWIMNVLNKRY